MNTVELQARQFISVAKLPAELVRENLSTSVELNVVLQELLVVMEYRLLSHNLGVTDYRWPSTWWEHVKERWLPAWAIQRWPVKYTNISVTAYHNYPTLSLPRSRGYFDIAVSEPFTRAAVRRTGDLPSPDASV